MSELAKKDYLLQATGITKTFGITKALTDVIFGIEKGEIRGLIGENGSGKSTLSNVITGSLQPDAGTMTLHGELYAPASIADSEEAKIGIMIQESGTINGLTVAENMFLGKEKKFAKGPIVSKRKMVKEATKALQMVGATKIKASAKVESYTFEERKMIEVAAVLYSDPEILIVDETTTALSKEGAQRIHEIMRERKAAGKSIIFISHDLEELEEICDSVTVLRDGCYVDTLYEGITVDRMRELMIGRSLEGHYYRTDKECSYQDEVVMKAVDVTYGERVQHLNFELHKGEILGFGGLADSGTHDLPKLLFGATKLDCGSVTVGNTKITSTDQAIKNKIAYLPKDRDIESLMSDASIGFNISLASYDKLKSNGLISKKKEKVLNEENAKALSIKMQGIDQEVRALSGGNKQKVVVAKWMANDSEILVMDSPTRGIDIGVKSYIYQMLINLKKQGKAIIIICDEMAELIGMADRIIILKDGCLSAELERNNLLAEHDLIEAMM